MHDLFLTLGLMVAGFAYLDKAAPLDVLQDILSLPSSRSNGPVKLDLAFVNNLPGTPQVYAYVTGRDTQGALVMLQSNNQWNHILPHGSPIPVKIAGDVKIPLRVDGIMTFASLPDYISSSRVYFAQGELSFATVGDDASLVEPSVFNTQDPNANVSYGFVELNYAGGVDVFDISYVDWVGLPLGITVTGRNGANQSIPGLPSHAVQTICQDLKTQAATDHMPWDQLCRKGPDDYFLRVWSAAQYITLNPNTAFKHYFTQQVNEIWTRFTTQSLTVNTQSANTALVPANVTCQVATASHMLTCDGDNRPYAKPTAGDILGCSTGTFAIQAGDNDIHKAVVPRLCAAFNRGTLLLPGGDIQPSRDAFYPAGVPSNQYSRIVHKWELQGQGYTFPYDDVVGPFFRVHAAMSMLTWSHDRLQGMLRTQPG